MRKSTIHNLPKDIENVIPKEERTPLINKIIEEAIIGEYHDYKNDKYICGKMALVSLLQKTGDNRLKPLIESVINGEYDEEADDNDMMNLQRDWTENGGDIETFKKLFGGK